MPFTDKTKRREYMRKYRDTHPEYREKAKEYAKEYGSNPEVQNRRSKRQTERLQSDSEFAKRRRAQWREWARENRETRERYKYERLYGITWEQRDAMLAAQLYRCKICSTDNPGRSSWHTDHCHKTGKVRGILCSNCNTLLGLSKESPDILAGAARYLEQFACSLL